MHDRCDPPRLPLVEHQANGARLELVREAPTRSARLPLLRLLVQVRHRNSLSLGVCKTGSSPGKVSEVCGAVGRQTRTHCACTRPFTLAIVRRSEFEGATYPECRARPEHDCVGEGSQVNCDVFQLPDGRFVVASYSPCSGEYLDVCTEEFRTAESPEELVELGAMTFGTRAEAENAARLIASLPD